MTWPSCRCFTSCLFAVSGLVLIAGCSPDRTEAEWRPTTIAELAAGVEADFDGLDAAIDAAIVTLPDSFPWYGRIQADLVADGIVVVSTGTDGYDAVIVYRTGPYCGRLPTITVNGNRDVLQVEVSPQRHGGECDSLEYDEAIALRLSEEFSDATVSASLRG